MCQQCVDAEMLPCNLPSCRCPAAFFVQTGCGTAGKPDEELDDLAFLGASENTVSWWCHMCRQLRADGRAVETTSEPCNCHCWARTSQPRRCCSATRVTLN